MRGGERGRQRGHSEDTAGDRRAAVSSSVAHAGRRCRHLGLYRGSHSEVAPRGLDRNYLTVRLTVVECETVPEVAVTVTV